MKRFFRAIVAFLLAHLARAIIAKYKPVIVMVTGSVGKTSTKDAVAAALSEKYFLRASEKSYNSEFGVPLTIIGAQNPWLDVTAWYRVIAEAFALVLFPTHYPKMLVLEVGADRPGDLKRILRIATPDAVVVTRLPEVPVHVEAYASPSEVREEEFAPAYALPEKAPLIISADDTYAIHLAARLSLAVHTYGYAADAQVQITDAKVLGTARPEGMRAQVVVGDSTRDLYARGALGTQQLYAPAAAIAVSLALGMTLDEALRGLENYTPPPGRARILEGIHESVLIDDSYNASPAAVEEALASLSLVKTKRRIAVIGDMLELGRYSVEEHERIGRLAAEKADIVIGVGPRAKKLADAALEKHKNKNRAFHYEDAFTAAEKLRTFLQPRDVVLIKASQGIRAERIVEALLAHPEEHVLLVRQEKEWKKRS